MRTPIADFVNAYAEGKNGRFHMPGHKGKGLLGCEKYDITEISGADDLYHPSGIIAESEANASLLFGTQKTLYSTEGSSQCIRAMLHLAVTNAKEKHPYILAGRNAHKAFLYAVAMLDVSVEWLWPKEAHSLCSCRITPQQLEEQLASAKELPCAVYLTSPDYLGGWVSIKEIAEICHRYQIMLLVDNAHGAYLHFLKEPCHPMDLGADMCCDSAHKTLPVLTGGAYLHIGKTVPKQFLEKAKQAMALYGSTSPSYLTMCSLDLCNLYLENSYKKALEMVIQTIENAKERLRENGWEVEETEPLKITLCRTEKSTGEELAARLRIAGYECEYADEDYVVCMLTPENDKMEIEKFVEVLGKNKEGKRKIRAKKPVICPKRKEIREAIFAPSERIPVEQSCGRICGAPVVSCPPAIPVVVSGEEITDDAIACFLDYKITEIEVLLEER